MRGPFKRTDQNRKKKKRQNCCIAIKLLLHVEIVYEVETITKLEKNLQSETLLLG